MKSKQLFWILLAVVVVALGAWWWSSRTVTPGKYNAFASCLKDKGATFYGAFWCPHCQNQKAMFGSSADLLPYVECSTPDGQSQLAVCRDKGVEGYPTWVFKDGSRQSGEVPLATLAEKTGCELPK